MAEITAARRAPVIEGQGNHQESQVGDSTGITSRHLVDPAFVMRRFVDIGTGPQRQQQSFRIHLPLQQISVFCRHYETSEALSRIPHFCIAQLGFPQLARAEEQMLLEADIEPQNAEAIAAFHRSLDRFRQVLTYPLGQVITDHAGYASFDLTALSQDSVRDRLAGLFETLGQEFVGRAANSPALQKELAGAKPEIGLVRLWVLPFTDMTLGIDALKSGDVAPNFIALRVDLSADELDGRDRDRSGAAMQHPSILDWRLSPGSFTMSSAAILGEDGCETLLPTNLSTQQFRFKQVIRSRASADVVEPGGQRFIVPRYAFAHVAEYLSEWFPIGHSLGQILYSLPLAPGEKVKIAVVDWSRTDVAKRDEKTTFVEQLQHSQLRDRSLTEAVHVALSEWQTGNSMMGGFAASAAAAIPLGKVDIGLGQALSLGASSASLEGGRDVTADTVQKISDAFQQASSAVRELKSTVVVQSEQSESSNVQTRVVANYNHSHALTMLYYEVLRHYRITTRLDKLRPALMVKYGGAPDVKLNSGSFAAAFLLGKRCLLEPRLLDTRLLPCFDAMNRVALGEMKLARETARWNASTQTTSPGAREFVKLVAQFTTGEDDSTEPVFVALVLTNGKTFEFQLDGAADEGASPEYEKALPAPIRWREIRGFEVKLKDINSGGDWTVTNITLLMATSANERTVMVADSTPRTLDDAGGSTGLLSASSPPEDIVSKVGAEPQRADFISADDDYSVQALADHCNANRGYYLRVLRLAEDPNQRVAWMESLSVAGMPLLEVIENRPLEVFGDYVTYPVNPGYERALAAHFHAEPVDSETLSMSFIEQLASLPTRGVFGEAKLGHCNASELLDTSRFWDWQTSPIPDDAPEISGADAGSRRETTGGLAPTAFPQSIVNIATPQALPDPTGLHGAFGLLSALGPFKDITGQKELGALLTTLSNNATSLAAKGMDVQQTKRLIDMVNSAPRVSDADKGQMITSALQDLCKPPAPPATPPIAPPGSGDKSSTAPAGPVNTGSGDGGVARPAPRNRVKPDKKNGRVLKLFFKKIDSAKPLLLNMLDLVSFGSYSNADIRSSEFKPITESNVEIPSNGTANLICTYQAYVFDEVALQAAVQRTIEEAKASWYGELKNDAQWLAEAATGVLFWKKVHVHFQEGEGKSLNEKLTQRVPVLSVNPATYLRPTEKTFEGNGHWLFKGTSPDYAVLEVTPLWKDAGKVTVAVTTSTGGEIGVEVKGGVSGKVVAIDFGVPLKLTSQLGGTTTYEIPVKTLEDTVTVVQTV